MLGWSWNALCNESNSKQIFVYVQKKKKKKQKNIWHSKAEQDSVSYKKPYFINRSNCELNAKVLSLAKKKVSPVKQQEFSLKKKMARRNNFQNSKIKPVHAFSLSDKCIFITVY